MMIRILNLFKSPTTWLLITVLALLSLAHQAVMMHREIIRVSRNQRFFRQTQQQIQLTNGRIAAQTGVLQLKQQELLTLFPELRKEISALGLRPRMVQSASTVSFGIQKQIISTLRDSLVLVPKDMRYTGAIGFNHLKRPVDSLRFHVFNYHDSYYDVSGYALYDKQVLQISTHDTMTQVVFRRRKHPLLWIFSKRILEQRVYFKNPDAHIYYSRTIQLQR